MNFSNLNLNSKAHGKAGQAQGLDLLGLSQQQQAEHLALLQSGEGGFAELLGQIGKAGEGLAELLGGANPNNPEEVFELIDNFPTDFKLNFLEELKQDLPNLVAGLGESGGTEKNLIADPSEIATKVQEVIDLVKEGGQKISEAFQKVFDGGVFDSLFKAEGDVASEKVMASLDAKLKTLTGKENPIKSKEAGDIANSDDAVQLHNFMQKNKRASKVPGQNKIKNFSQFNNKANLFKQAEQAEQAPQVQAESNALQKIFKAQKSNPYMDSSEQSLFKANQQTMAVESTGSENLMDSFMGQNGSQLNMDFMASQQMQEGGEIQRVEGSSEGQVLDFSKITENSNNKAEVIKNVTNYLEQVQFNNQKELDVAVRHNELGEFNIQVSKDAATNNLDLQIKAASEEGVNFFQENEAELVKTLNDKGIKLSSLKIGAKGESIMSSGMEKSDSGSSNQQGRGDQSQSFAQHKGQQGKDHNGQERRRELWQKYQEQMAS